MISVGSYPGYVAAEFSNVAVPGERAVVQRYTVLALAGVRGQLGVACRNVCGAVYSGASGAVGDVLSALDVHCSATAVGAYSR